MIKIIDYSTVFSASQSAVSLKSLEAVSKIATIDPVEVPSSDAKPSSEPSTDIFDEFAYNPISACYSIRI